MPSELEKLNNQIEELAKKRQAILEAERGKKLEEIKAVIEQYGITASELGFIKRRAKAKGPNKAKLPARYRNPRDPSQTWHGGKGAKPKWIREFLAAGGKLEKIEIKK